MASSVYLFSSSHLSAVHPCKHHHRHHRHCHRCRSHHHRCKPPSLDISGRHLSSFRCNSGVSCQLVFTKSRVYRCPIAGKMSSSQESLPLSALNVSQGKQSQNTEELQEDDLENGYYELQLRNTPRREMSLMGVKLSPDLVAIVMVYFVQGVLGLSRLAVSFYLKDDLHLDPAESAVISGLSAAPWLIKPVYGFISDGLPLFGYRRRSYLVLCGLLGATAWAMMAMLVDNKYTAGLAIIVSSLSVAFSDVVVDSMAVERARGESQSTSGSIQSLCWGSSAFGGIVSAYFSGSLIETYGVRFVFSVTSLLPLITSAVAVFVTEEKVSKAGYEVRSSDNMDKIESSSAVERSRAQLIYLWKTMKEPSIFLPTLFIFLLQATPTSDTAMFFFTTNKLGFGPEFLGRVRLITSIASLAGVGIYNGLLKSVPLRKMFFWTTFVGCGLSLTQLVLVTGANQNWGISNEWFAMGDTLILTVLGQISFMPILVLAARICPPGIEATLFATLMSISNGGSVCGGLIGAWLTQFLGITSQKFDNLALLLILCNASSLLPLPLLGLLPSENAKPSEYRSLDTHPDNGDEFKRN